MRIGQDSIIAGERFQSDLYAAQHDNYRGDRQRVSLGKIPIVELICLRIEGFSVLENEDQTFKVLIITVSIGPMAIALRNLS